MAIFHLSVKAVSRSNGRSAVAAAAYRAGSELVDERSGLVHDFTRKGGVDREHSPGIVLPAGASATLADQGALWNAAEKAEKRKDACTAREYEVALPAELDARQRGALVLAFAQALAARLGVAVDARIHAPGGEGDARNWHAHVLTTTRVAGPEGLGEKAAIEKSGRDRKADLVASRKLWEGLVNDALEKAGSTARVDHRSLEDQGIERVATLHLGPEMAAMERRGEATVIGDHNRSVVSDLAERRELVAERARVAAELAEVEALLTLPRAELHRRLIEVRPLPARELLMLVPGFEAHATATAAADLSAEIAQRKIDRENGSLEQWREAHPLRAWLHDRGLWPDDKAERSRVEIARLEAMRDAACAQLEALRSEGAAKRDGWLVEAEKIGAKRAVDHANLSDALTARDVHDAQERWRAGVGAGPTSRPRGLGL